MDRADKKKINTAARKYILAHPDCSYDQLVKDLPPPHLSKSYFFNMRGQIGKKRNAPADSSSNTKLKGTGGKQKTSSNLAIPHLPALMTVEILETLDTSHFSEEVKGFFKTHAFPLIKKLLPEGPTLQMVFLTDPPTLEIRRLIS